MNVTTEFGEYRGVVFDCQDCGFRSERMDLATIHYTDPKTKTHQLHVITV